MSSKTQEVGTVTEPESLGPCEPGTAINLDGIVWNETKGGKIWWNLKTNCQNLELKGFLFEYTNYETGHCRLYYWLNDISGMLSLNITWRGKSYMGTLIDCSITEHAGEWAAPW